MLMLHDVKVMVRLPSKLKRRIQQAAKAKLTTESEIIRQAVLAQLPEPTKKP